MATTDRRPVTSGIENRTIRIVWYALLVGVLIAGAYATYLRVVGGIATTNLTSITPWGAWVAFYIYFAGLSAGAFLLSTLSSVFGMERLRAIQREALLAAIVAMVAALLFIWIDLGRMERLFNPFLHRQITSPLSWEVHAYVIYMGILLAGLYFSMRADLVRVAERASGIRAVVARVFTLGRTDLSEAAIAADRVWQKRVSIVGIPLAVFLVLGGEGVLFAVAKARPYWNSGLFPVIFVVSAIVAGTALVLTVYVLRRTLFAGPPVDVDIVDRLAQILLAFVLVDVAFTAIDALIALTTLEQLHVGTWLLLATGDMAWSFWVFMVGLGWVVPAILTSRRTWRRRPWLMVIAGLSVVVGIVGVRFNIVVPPLVLPVMELLPQGEYFPSLVEWGTSAGIIAFGLLVYTIGAELLPLTPLEGDSK
ncbi:NrfD/PsrC family molybdoenzyme membrane anchor subunit [Halanaeroarchaeum sulfurireducens]|uniref:Molybdopterin oxidoreductase, membrane subunit n=1 Tax=Halanaeroarchaeum sulfurireducens TaxID=1604004 RepID=A0A0F7PCE0_9EURY|nr:NrfD/PsrC family molybdoenzyme membrane anchor subunit [Halanaeroarchaeum sulfurireducens]AKH97028.1 molybdopterin oxidoreductase, membrane subunit [Halanaeroarchaeum sulfurireducens]